MDLSMNQQWKQARLDGKLVRVDSVRAGTRVLTAYSGEVEVLPDGGERGTSRGKTDDGRTLTFAHCAEVLVLPKGKTGAGR